MASNGTESVWMADTSLPHFPTLDALDGLEVVIVGGGISGLTSGLLLQRAGYRTAVLEQQNLGGGETGRTSAHLTEFPDLGFARLIADFGLETAKGVVRSQRHALQQVEALAREIPCDFARVPGYLFAEPDGDRDRLDDELAAAHELGVTAARLDSAPLPFATNGAISFAEQAVFHPLKYIAGLIRLYADAGGTISERTHVRGIDESDQGCRLRTDRSLIHCRHVVAVTDAPIAGGPMLDTKLRANRTYLIALRTPSPMPPGLYWDTAEPYHYIREATTAEGRFVMVGGEDHRVGTDAEVDALTSLEGYSRQRFNAATVFRQWSGQIMESVDGLPFIGPREAGSHVFVATGYSGNGLTFGTLAAQLSVDAIAGQTSPFAAIYAPDRALGPKQWAKYAAQNLPAAWTLVTDMLPHAAGRSVDELKPGEGAVLRIGGEMAAAARDLDGVVHVVSSTCTHMGCEVAWNPVERTWDCPCHGSRFTINGTVLHGPATTPLATLAAVVGKSTSTRSR